MSLSITSDQGDYTGELPLLFLAGPCLGAPPWQQEVIVALSDLDIAIANPRLEKRFPSGNEERYLAQINWESRHLRKASTESGILFWMPPEADPQPHRSYAQTTRYELAEWMTRRSTDPSIRLYIGIDDDFSGKRYIRNRSLVPVYDTLEEVLAAVRAELLSG
jgi:hypothetical protein